ncbi:hypothetical protein FrEUN1fDRAFT_0037 [Parafrankia sp. EUN1f]|nr:hypothetical protein FrEUN1fDRAFT_0037 [Parafrankia sp. EUN1f]
MPDGVVDALADADRIGVPGEVRAAARRVCNWGRWGSEDELGTLNHISPASVARAGTLIRQGKMFSLSVPLDSYGPQGAGPVLEVV